MEKFFSQKRILIYIIIALVVFNIATIGGILFYLKNERHDSHEGRSNKMMHKVDFIKEKLQLNESQLIDYQMYHDAFYKRGKILIDSMQVIRKHTIDHMTVAVPDTAAIDELNRKFGNLHTELKNNAVDFYFKLKKICTPSQQDTLKIIFTKMLEFEGGRKPFKDGHYKSAEKQKHH